MRPPLTCVASTYFPTGEPGRIRAAAALEALQSWSEHLIYGGQSYLHVADDGSDDSNWKHFEVALASSLSHDVTIQNRRGVGASLNAGFRAGFERSPLVFYGVDDWLLREDVDLTLWADLLLEHEDIGVVRLGPPHPGIKGFVEMFSVDHEEIPPNDEMGGWFLRLRRYGFTFAHRPALYHQRFIERYGWFAEGVNAFECERLYSEHYNDTSGPDVVFALPCPWYHMDTIELADIEPGG